MLMGKRKGTVMMMKTLCFGVVIWMALTGLCMAQSFDFQLHAGSKSLSAEAHYRNDLAQGYAKIGLVGVYTDDGDTQYNWGGVRVVVGNDTLVQGLSCEVGMVALYGDAEDRHYEGDVGTLAFDIRGKYLFPERVLPIPLEVISSIRYSPDLMSFRDVETYTEFNLGLGVQLIENASVTLIFTKYLVDFEAGPGPWELDEDVIRGGIVLHF
jgi:hypothetical protein